jgi:hypothetical protein
MGSCGTNKNYLDRNDADKSLQDAVKKLRKNPDDEKATEALPVLYKLVKQKHLDQIKAYEPNQQLSKWDYLIKEYQYLQDAYDVIINSPAAFRLVTPTSYTTNILSCNDSAATAYYNFAESYLKKGGRDNAKIAYNDFKKASKYNPDIKDINEKLKAAFEEATVEVLINPVNDNSIFNNPMWRVLGNNYNKEYFQNRLFRDLEYNNHYAAKFYNEQESRRLNIEPDWSINFNLKNFEVPYPSKTYAQRSVSKSIQIGTDTSGKPVYNTVYATINSTKSSFTTRAIIEMSIVDIGENKSISFKSYNETYKWEEETATFSGDKRAINENDWNIINNSGLNEPSKDDIIKELYNKIYPQVLNDIRQSVAW